MRNRLTAALLACLTIAAPAVADAQALRFDPSLRAAADTAVQTVAYRHRFRGGGFRAGGFHGGAMRPGFHGGGIYHGGGMRPGAWGHGVYHGGYARRGGWYAGGGYYRGGVWYPYAAGAAGLAAGAAIGAAAASTYAAPAGDAAAYCAGRYRSYDPASGTFLGYDGLRHPCP